MRAFIFPGQGSQSVGMGQALAAASKEARAVFEEVDEALGLCGTVILPRGEAERRLFGEELGARIRARLSADTVAKTFAPWASAICTAA